MFFRFSVIKTPFSNKKKTLDIYFQFVENILAFYPFLEKFVKKKNLIDNSTFNYFFFRYSHFS